jgi:hypothetical protein
VAWALQREAAMPLATAARLLAAILSSTTLAACGVGSAGPGAGDDLEGDPARVPSSDPADDERLDTLGIVCQSDRVNLKITTGGDGRCHGTFDHFGADRRVVELRPTLGADGQLAGEGVYSVYAFDPF